jgi:PRTRC genetic system ThiF family protein
VDKVQARFEIAAILQQQHKNNAYYRDNPCYWMDFGNGRNTGQVVLATIGKIEQPASKKFTTVDSLPLPTQEFKELFEAAKEDNTPSCSLAEALTKQDLFINASLADLGGSLLWQLLSEGMIENRGFFLNLRNFKTEPLKVA